MSPLSPNCRLKSSVKTAHRHPRAFPATFASTDTGTRRTKPESRANQFDVFRFDATGKLLDSARWRYEGPPDRTLNASWVRSERA